MPLLNWLNKDSATKAAAKSAYRLLEEIPELSYGDKTSENLLIQGDNLEALKALIPFYAGKVKCIYIDPPYNTGKAFEHYDDNIEESLWLSLIYPRLELLNELIDPKSGYIAVQIDDKQFANLYLIMGEIFGRSNLKTICIKMSESSGVKMAPVKKYGLIPKLKEYVILAKKDGIRGLSLPTVPKSSWDSEYNILLNNFNKEDKLFIDEVNSKGDVSNDDIEKLDLIANRTVLASVAEYTKNKGITGKEKNKWLFENAYRICQCATSSTVLKLSEVKREYSNSPLFFVASNKRETAYFVRANYKKTSKKPRLQLIFAEDNLSVHAGDFWSDIKTTGLDGEGGVSFKNGKKPEEIVERIINMATEEGDIVLDSFSGSGTTAAVAHKMKRQYIGIEVGEHAKTHCRLRLKSIVDGKRTGNSRSINWYGGGGFRFCKLGATVFDEFGVLNHEIRFPTLAAHVWYIETRLPLGEKKHSPLIGTHNETAYYLLYNGILGDKRPNGGNVLTGKVLDCLPEFDGKKVIYGETTRLGEARLKQENITFKQIPYDVKAL